MVHVQVNISTVLREQGKLPEALTMLYDALAIFEKILGQDHPDAAKTYGNMGCVYQSMGDFPKALECHNRDLEIKL